MASRRASPPLPALPRPAIDLEITIISAKHLKNVNWRNGDLKPYAVAYIDPDRRVATKSDDSGGVKPVWNEKLPLLPLPDCSNIINNSNSFDLSRIYLTVDVFHSKPSETPKPLVGTARAALGDLLHDQYPNSMPPIKTLDLRRPSGRPHGNIRIKLALKERPAPTPPPSQPTEQNYQIPPPPSGYSYYSGAPPPPLPATREYARYSPVPPPPSYMIPYSYAGYSDSYMGSGYYSSPAYYSTLPAQAPPQPQPHYDRIPPAGYGGPSAPAEHLSGSSSYYEPKTKGSKAGFGSGLAVGAVAGALGGLALEEAVKYEEETNAERVEDDMAVKDDYSSYQDPY